MTKLLSSVLVPARVAAGLSSVVLAFIVFYSFFLRPICDSYVYGQADITFDGPIGGMLMWMTYNNPMLVKEFMNSVFVGMPIISLPWWLSSSLTFLLTLGLLALVLYKLNVVKPGLLNRKVFVLVVTAFTSLSWIVYWFVYSVIPTAGRSGFMGMPLQDNHIVRKGLFFDTIDNQVTLISYVASVLVVMLLSIWLNSWSRLNSWLGYLAAAAVGLLLAQVSFTTSFAVIGLLVLGLIFWRFIRKHYQMFNYSWKHMLVMMVTAGGLTGWLLASPAVVERSKLNNVQEFPWVERSVWNNEYVPRDLFETVGYISAHSFMDWVLMFAGWGTVLFLVFCFGVGLLFKTLKVEFNRKALIGFAILFKVSGLLFNVSVAASHLKVYNASWHQTTVGLMYMLSIVCFGLWLSSFDKSDKPLVKWFVWSAACLFSIMSLFSYSTHVADRAERWQNGSIPSSYSSDTDVEWAIFAWFKVIEYRGEENFRNIRDVYTPGLYNPPYPFLWELEKQKAVEQNG